MEGEVIVVVVDASKEITDYALEWAVRNVVKPMDSLILLAILSFPGHPPTSANRNHHQSRVHRFLPCLLKNRNHGNKHQESSSKDELSLVSGNENDVPYQINIVCVEMMRQLCSAHKIMQVHTEVKVVGYAQIGSVAMKAQELGATWVVLDRRLKKESDSCLLQLDCNIILVDHAIPKILKAVDQPTARKVYMNRPQTDPTVADMLGMIPTYNLVYNTSTVTTHSSNGVDSRSSQATNDTFSLPSTDKDQLNMASPPITRNKPNDTFISLNSQKIHHEVEPRATFTPARSYSKSQPLNKVSKFEHIEGPRKSSASPFEGMNKGISVKATETQTVPIPFRRSIDSPSSWRKQGSVKQRNVDQQMSIRRDYITANRVKAMASPSSPTIDRISSVRKAMSLSIKQPQTPPPLCSVCKNNAPIFGKALRKFSYKEVEWATKGFSSKNFLAEGGYGPVYKGVLPDGRIVAVKQNKKLSAQGASEFCSEVEVLSCAQHRNLVMLVGYCTEIEWLLIYEFACNGSLDKHLYGTNTNEVMAWHNRMKVAIGAARGLRYLHEDCRVGCIVHRDFRPNNILLTHDFEPMVGDFGLARWQADGQTAEETRVFGAFGYLAPEYTQTGLVTEKTDVYAFGIVLLELLSSIKATDLSRSTGQQYLSEWGRSLLEKKICREIIDTRMEENYVEKEVDCMMFAASLCISPDPEQRPRMSKVLKILEGDMPSDMAYNQQRSFIDLKQKTNGYATDRPLKQTLDYSPSYLRQSMQHMNLSPSSQRAHINNEYGNKFKEMIPSDKMFSGAWGLNQPEQFVSEEYQTYLQGSLSKFIQNLNQG